METHPKRDRSKEGEAPPKSSSPYICHSDPLKFVIPRSEATRNLLSSAVASLQADAQAPPAKVFFEETYGRE